MQVIWEPWKCHRMCTYDGHEVETGSLKMNIKIISIKVNNFKTQKLII